MKKIALLFAGQGAQVVGMGKDLADQFPIAADLFRQADEILDRKLSEIAWNGPIGVYKASASWAEGILKGETYQKDKPSARANWTAGPFARRREN